MTQRGQRQAQSGVDALKPYGYDTAPLLTSGLFMGPGYYYAWYPLYGFLWAQSLAKPYSGFIDGPTAIGEFSIGASLGLGMARTLLPGKPSGQPAVSLCTGKMCGDDGCGGSCGDCPAGQMCASGQCVVGSDGGVLADGSAAPHDGAMSGSSGDAGSTPPGGPPHVPAPGKRGCNYAVGVAAPSARDAGLFGGLCLLFAIVLRRRRGTSAQS
jgi:hypothetical protein